MEHFKIVNERTLDFVAKFEKEEDAVSICNLLQEFMGRRDYVVKSEMSIGAVDFEGRVIVKYVNGKFLKIVQDVPYYRMKSEHREFNLYADVDHLKTFLTDLKPKNHKIEQYLALNLEDEVMSSIIGEIL